MTITVTTTTQPTVAPARPRISVAPAIRALLHRLTPATGRATSRQTPPTGRPGDLPTGSVRPADTYPRGAAVWAYIAGKWLTAIVTEVDGNSVVVTYRVPGTGEAGLETMHASHIVPCSETPARPAEPF